MAPGGAEFFPSCTQLRILGNGSEVPAPNSIVRFPGAYNATDPGILFDVRYWSLLSFSNSELTRAPACVTGVHEPQHAVYHTGTAIGNVRQCD